MWHDVVSKKGEKEHVFEINHAGSLHVARKLPGEQYVTRIVTKEQYEEAIRQDKEKSAIVETNVSSVRAMSPGEIKAIHAEFSSNNSTFLILFNKVASCDSVLNALKDGTFRSLVGENGVPATLWDRCSELDPETVEGYIKSSRIHPFFSNRGIFVSPNHNSSALPIPYFERFMEMRDPNVDWIAHANDPIIAQFRIIVRNSIVNSTIATRFGISPRSDELTIYLIWIFISAAKDIAFQGKTKGTKAVVSDFDDTRTCMIRVLVCLIMTTCAAGKFCICPAHTFFSSKPVRVQKQDLWIVKAIAELSPFTGWDIKMIEHATSINKKLYM